MESALIPPAQYFFLFIPAAFFSVLIPVCGTAVFTYIMALRMAPLVRSAPDNRFDQVAARVMQLLRIWLLQYRHPRYMLAGILHILLFAGFLILSLRSISLVVIGFYSEFVMPGLTGVLGDIYNVLKDYAATWIFVTCVVAAVRRGIFKPVRYAVPPEYGKDHTGEAILVLGLIGLLMISESLFEATLAAAQVHADMHAEFIAPFTLAWMFKHVFSVMPLDTLQALHILSYYVHDFTFFFFLCFLPLGKHFHVITSLFNVFFMRVKRGNVKPVRYGVDDESLDDLESFGVKRLEDFTWKHLLDFYTCADCGRCSDHCPANAAGRPLSPRFISIKGRDLTFRNYPVYPYGAAFRKSLPLVGTIYDKDEIWSCTTCGACEQECPVGIEYIDKIVDLRRGMVDEGQVPQSLQKPLRALEKRGNPWGKLEKKRVEWTLELSADRPVKVLGKGSQAQMLYFVDSVTAFDDRMQQIARAAVSIFHATGTDFGILGKVERDSGHEVRRFGEEMLFQDLRDRNTDAILNSGVSQVVTTDPHAFNALKNDYGGLPPVAHVTQFIAHQIREGGLRLKSGGDDAKVYTYHDPCYLGRHNELYDDPRFVIDTIPGAKRVEMKRCRDRSFCCGGGGLMLFYEPKEEQRMGVLRVEMAAEAGAEVIVTACPFCLVNIEDAIKVAGMEGKMAAMDITELVARHLDDAPVDMSE